MNITIKQHTRSSDGTCVIVGEGLYRADKGILWEKAGSPNKLAPHCIDLDYFKTEKDLSVGNKVSEVHNFIGIKQKYEGTITDYSLGDHWEMSTEPTSINKYIFGLPHKVRYEFSNSRHNNLIGKIRVRCDYGLKGILKLPIIRKIVMNRMQKAVGLLLISPANC